MGYGVNLLVWGERACFTRPEMKVERVSYDAMDAFGGAGNPGSHSLEAGDPAGWWIRFRF